MTDGNYPLLDANRVMLVDRILDAHGAEDWDFDRMTRLAAKCLRTPICLVSLVTSDRQVFAGACGLPNHLEETRETPLDYSICKHAVMSRSLLVIRDAVNDPLVSEIRSVTEYGLSAYLGCPLMTEDGEVLGSFCAIDFVPRDWTEEDTDMIRDFAALAVERIEARILQARSRSAFDVVIHDLRSPLTGIVMASALIEEKPEEVPGRFQKLLGVISEASAKALRLVEFLAKENRQEKVDSCADFRHTLAVVVRRQQELAARKSISLVIEECESAALAVGAWVLEQVIENLLSNAIKYSPPESTVTMTPQVADGIVHLLIEDEGPGFSAADRQRMYRRYVRLSASPTGNETSTGLGLSIVKRLVEQHGGSIELLPNKEGVGARFRVSFPALGHGT